MRQKAFCPTRCLATNMTDTTENNAVQSTDEWAQNWSEMLQHAKTRPQMFLGDQATAHRHIMSTAFRLVWQAKVLRQPQRVHVVLSPNQCTVRCDAGPLIRPVQEMFSFPGGQVMGEDWQKEGRDYFQRIQAEDEARGLEWSKQRHRRGWRYCFSGPIGPRLWAFWYDALFAVQFTWGLRTDEGLWCQAYRSGLPNAEPFLIHDPSPIGLFVLADLDPLWFTGLPFDAEDVDQRRSAANRQAGVGQQYKPQPAWSTGEIEAVWYEADDLVTEKSLTAEGVREWLQARH